MENLVIRNYPQQPPFILLYQSPDFRLDPAANQIVTNDKLRSFSALPIGWHYGEGIPPSRALISRLVEINNKAYGLGFSRTDAFPMVSGGIMLTLYYDDHLIDLTVETDKKTATYLYERNGEEIAYHEDIELSTAIKMIEEVGELCRLSEPSTRFIMQKLNIGSRVQPLKLPVMGESQFFLLSALPSTQETFVSTSTNITSHLELQAIPRFTGNLEKIYYPTIAIENEK